MTAKRSQILLLCWVLQRDSGVGGCWYLVLLREMTALGKKQAQMDQRMGSLCSDPHRLAERAVRTCTKGMGQVHDKEPRCFSPRPLMVTCVALWLTIHEYLLLEALA